jgi:phosphatidylglycerophosphatase C
VTLPALDANELIAKLEALRPRDGAAGVAFDGDGTLWWGDVAEDVLMYAAAKDLIRPEAHRALSEAAAAHGVSAAGSPSQIAARIFEAYLHGAFPELEVCEVMTWCYAGHTRDELVALARDGLGARDFAGRLNPALRPLVEWARQARLRTVVVSASPQPIVEVAAESWGFQASQVAASPLAFEGERIAARMGGPVPYAAAKRDAGRHLLGSAVWLASFGDSAFDLEMLGAAELGVAVNPKPQLRARLGELARAVVLA